MAFDKYLRNSEFINILPGNGIETIGVAPPGNGIGGLIHQ